MRRRAVLCSVASATLGSTVGYGESTFESEDPRSKDEYGTVRCRLDGERTTDPAEQSTIDGLDGATGAVAWRLQLDEYIHPSGGLAVHGDACFLATQTDLLRIDLTNGTIEWRLTGGGPATCGRAPRTVTGDGSAALYVASSPAVTPPDGGESRSSPTVFGDVRAPSMATQLHAVDAETGAVHWRAPVATGWGNDVCVGGDVVFVSQGEFLVALDRDTGAILYGVEQYQSRGTVALVDDAIFAGDVYRHVYAVA